ncbi:DeoR/GlpR transcriptional regulator [Pseudomonas syringae]|nr:DeoR/GlpR transcriptional regulator [Pseudomonas syringae]MBD8576165.1 DeoR/GlpR transcriptional regulator [Pseudomonas syringae]MBD8792209.1 DeoR/GlpR transcriptional regulator [Pseudomonas syringae]MBD8804144.1 DeoR/GlpR transcriptional regulator [Pseudomonas syringae]MBD8814340.1 DeoR/GlpR transcriptional regulator [Pseudomonas syringae]
MSTHDEIAPTGGAPMIPDQRRELMLRQLRKHQVLSVHQLMEMFDCSHMTIRRDIALLEQEGRAYSVSGGVRIASQLHSEPSHQSKAVVELPHKQAMARLAAQLLHADMTVYLDAGTTTLEIVPYIIALSGMTVVTNDFGIVHALADAGHVDVIHTGGLLDHPNLSSVGALAAATLRQLATDIAFMSTSSWDLQRGITTPSALKVDVKQAAMQSASRSVLVATSSKYGTFGMYKVAPLEQFDALITDADLATAAADSIRKQGIELQLATV